MAQAYATVTGADLGDWDFYLGLANRKLGVIAEGITHRALLRRVVGAEGAERAAEATAAFIAAGLNAVSKLGRRDSGPLGAETACRR